PVLVVDDNATNRLILDELLRSWRMRPRLSDDGAAALAGLRDAAAAGEPFALVLLDCHMPGMDGFDLAARIQAEPTLAGTPLVMLTSAGRPDDLTRCRDLGISAYLMKPIKQSELLQAILHVLGMPRVPVGLDDVTPTAVVTRPLRILVAEDNA